MRDLVTFVQFKKREKHPWRSVTFSAKSNTLPWVFSCFLSCTNGSKSRKASQLVSPVNFQSRRVTFQLPEGTVVLQEDLEVGKEQESDKVALKTTPKTLNAFSQKVSEFITFKKNEASLFGFCKLLINYLDAITLKMM